MNVGKVMQNREKNYENVCYFTEYYSNCVHYTQIGSEYDENHKAGEK